MKGKGKIRRVLLWVLAFVLLCVLVWAVIWHYRSPAGRVVRYATANPMISDRTLLCAHRSGGGVWPEESLPAFRSCAESGEFHVDCFEFDLHLTKDDRLVLMHDDDLDRTTDSEAVFGRRGVAVRDKTLEELKMLNIGAKFTTDGGERPYSGCSGESVPDDLRILTLEEALDYLTGTGSFRYIIELKNGGADGMLAADLLYRQLKDRDLLSSAVVCSYHDEVLKYMDEHHPDALRGASLDETLEFIAATLLRRKDYNPAFKAVQLPYGNALESRGLNVGLAAFVNYAHARDIAVQYWTINETDDMEYLIGIGADAIMTDYPQRLAEVLEKK